MTIGVDIKNDLFRDTVDYYLHASDALFSQSLIDYALPHLGEKVLDLGCATGNYMTALNKRGFQCTGADVNSAYVEIARKKGLDVHTVSNSLPFPDKSFDSVVIFEVAEHLQDPLAVLSEAKRVARKSIILTVPNCEKSNELRQCGLVFEHFLDSDHKNFFTEASMRKMLSQLFSSFEIKKGDPINPIHLIESKGLIFFKIVYKILCKLKLIKPKFYFRLYVAIDLNEKV